MTAPVLRPSSPLRGRGALAGVLAGAGAAALVVLALWDPARTGLFPPCLVHEATGLHCAGCGSQRALHALLHGRLGAAVESNLLLVLTLPFLLYGLGRATAGRFLGRDLPRVPVRAVMIWGLLGLVVLFTVLRNLPFFPFTALAPGS